MTSDGARVLESFFWFKGLPAIPTFLFVVFPTISTSRLMRDHPVNSEFVATHHGILPPVRSEKILSYQQKAVQMGPQLDCW